MCSKPSKDFLETCNPGINVQNCLLPCKYYLKCTQTKTNKLSRGDLLKHEYQKHLQQKIIKYSFRIHKYFDLKMKSITGISEISERTGQWSKYDSK